MQEDLKRQLATIEAKQKAMRDKNLKTKMNKDLSEREILENIANWDLNAPKQSISQTKRKSIMKRGY
ncbi:hypothetical protein DMB95_00170 [Campylobacter sp. MIT 12-8780]|nr:hypothetical protein DMB95_00170 [Campylobacter sp. MIT 12-8780]